MRCFCGQAYEPDDAHFVVEVKFEPKQQPQGGEKAAGKDGEAQTDAAVLAEDDSGRRSPEQLRLMARNLRPTLRHNLERRLKVVFDTIDADSDGFLTQDEVSRMGKELGRELQDMLSAVRSANLQKQLDEAKREVTAKVAALTEEQAQERADKQESLRLEWDEKIRAAAAKDPAQRSLKEDEAKEKIAEAMEKLQEKHSDQSEKDEDLLALQEVVKTRTNALKREGTASDSLAQMLIDTLDADKDGKVTWGEFQQLIPPEETPPEEAPPEPEPEPESEPEPEPEPEPAVAFAELEGVHMACSSISNAVAAVQAQRTKLLDELQLDAGRAREELAKATAKTEAAIQSKLDELKAKHALELQVFDEQADGVSGELSDDSAFGDESAYVEEEDEEEAEWREKERAEAREAIVAQHAAQLQAKEHEERKKTERNHSKDVRKCEKKLAGFLKKYGTRIEHGAKRVRVVEGTHRESLALSGSGVEIVSNEGAMIWPESSLPALEIQAAPVRAPPAGERDGLQLGGLSKAALTVAAGDGLTCVGSKPAALWSEGPAVAVSERLRQLASGAMVEVLEVVEWDEAAQQAAAEAAELAKAEALRRLEEGGDLGAVPEPEVTEGTKPAKKEKKKGKKGKKAKKKRMRKDSDIVFGTWVRCRVSGVTPPPEEEANAAESSDHDKPSTKGQPAKAQDAKPGKGKGKDVRFAADAALAAEGWLVVIEKTSKIRVRLLPSAGTSANAGKAKQAAENAESARHAYPADVELPNASSCVSLRNLRLMAASPAGCAVVHGRAAMDLGEGCSVFNGCPSQRLGVSRFPRMPLTERCRAAGHRGRCGRSRRAAWIGAFDGAGVSTPVRRRGRRGPRRRQGEAGARGH